jgi:hypothetical protein
MTVRQLIATLLECAPSLDTEVVLAKDEEGNRFSPLVSADAGNATRLSATPPTWASTSQGLPTPTPYAYGHSTERN